VKADADYVVINTNLDLIKLLWLIRTSMYTSATSKYKIHALYDAIEKLYAFKQGSRIENAIYLQTFQSHVDAINYLNGDFGIHHSIVVAMMVKEGTDITNLNQYQQAMQAARDEYMAKTMILQADPK
jgi:hypothetical protein